MIAKLFFRLAAVPLCLLCAAAAGAPEHAHRHGVVSMDVALEGRDLVVSFEAPLESLLGFERAPRTPAERAAAEALMRRMQDTSAWLRVNEAAGCRAKDVRLEADVLTAAAPRSETAHAELQANLSFTCTRPERLETLQVALFEAFPRVAQVQARYALAGRQGRAVLRPNAPALVLRR